MVAAPADTPVVTPVFVLTVAVAALLDHVPPVVVLVSVVLPPMHIDDNPEIAGSGEVTVTVVIRTHPAAFV